MRKPAGSSAGPAASLRPGHIGRVQPRRLSCVTASRDTAFIWNVETGEIIGRPMRHKAAVRSAHFSRGRPDGGDRLRRSHGARVGRRDRPTRERAAAPRESVRRRGVQPERHSDCDGVRRWHRAHVGSLSGSSADAGLLASLAEAVGGSVLGLRGVAAQLNDPISVSTNLRRQTAGASGRGIPAFIRWFLSDRHRQAATPWSESPRRPPPVAPRSRPYFPLFPTAAFLPNEFLTSLSNLGRANSSPSVGIAIASADVCSHPRSAGCRTMPRSSCFSICR